MTNPERKGWRTVRVIVEVPTLGKYSEKDLRWDVARCLEERLSVRHRSHNKLARFGSPKVKEYSRVMRQTNNERESK